MADRGCDFSIFEGIHVRFDTRYDMSISVRSLTPDLASRHIYRINSNETNQAGAGDVITSRLRDKLKTLYRHYRYRSVYSHQTWLVGNLP